MSDTLMRATAWAAGVGLGLVFFAGLRWTIRGGKIVTWSALGFLGGLLARMGIVLVGFYFVVDGRWDRFLLALLGFILGRLLLLWWTLPRGKHHSLRPGPPRVY